MKANYIMEKWNCKAVNYSMESYARPEKTSSQEQKQYPKPNALDIV